MNELYWIFTIGNLSVATWVIFSVSMTALVIMFLWWSSDSDIRDPSCEGDHKKVKVFKSFLKKVVITVCVSLIGSLFLPSKQELFIIYGVGNTIDYLKENDAAKQLPDKTIKCLDKILDGYLNDNEEDKK